MIIFVGMKKNLFRTNIPVAILLFLLPVFSIANTSAHKPTSMSSQDSIADSTDSDYQEYTDAMSIYGQVLQNLMMYYVDKIPLEQITEKTINCMLDELDPYTVYYSKESKDNLNFIRTGEYSGVGATLMARPDNSIMVVSVVKNMPANKAGIIPGDVILEINKEDMRGKSLPEVSEKLRGKAGTDIEVKVRRNGKKQTFRFKRESVVIPPITFFGILPNSETGYISLNTFNDKTYQQTKNALLEMKKTGKLKSLILDLRDNGGGLLSEAIRMVNLFIPKDKEVARLKGRDNEILATYKTEESPLFPNLPVVILINDGTASSSEIVAGAMQDYDRAVIMGSQSFGKGVVQSVVNLPGEGMMKFTTSRYHTPSGRCLQKENLGGRINSSTKDSVLVFHTSNGREVKGGGGIYPDIELKRDTTDIISYFLRSDIPTIDFAIDYVRKHKKIAKPFEFKLSDKDFNDLVEILVKSDYQYNKPNQRNLDTIEKNAKIDGTYDQAKEAIENLRKALKPDLRKELFKHKKEVSAFVEMMILRNYYYDEGAFAHTLLDDKDVLAAEKLLKNINEYRSALSNRQTEEK